jgi:hypothetical protein
MGKSANLTIHFFIKQLHKQGPLNDHPIPSGGTLVSKNSVLSLQDKAGFA